MRNIPFSKVTVNGGFGGGGVSLTAEESGVLETAVETLGAATLAPAKDAF
jgi:hypothetical protein